MGVARVRRLRMAFSLSGQLSMLPPKPFERITSPRGGRRRSSWRNCVTKKGSKFMILLLNTKNHVLSQGKVSVGGLNASIVHPRRSSKSQRKAALRSSWCTIIPAVILRRARRSRGDEAACRSRLRILGVAVRDHIIIGDGCYFSFKEKGLLLGGDEMSVALFEEYFKKRGSPDWCWLVNLLSGT